MYKSIIVNIIFIKYRLYFIFFVFIFLACSHKKTIKVERISNVKYYTVTNDIYPTLPGRLLYQDGKIFWEDALNSLLFMHMYDEKTGKELYSFANKGSGPEEFNRPTPTLLPDGGLMIKDLGSRLAIIYKPSGDTLKGTPTAFLGGGNWTRIAAINDSTLVYLYPGKEIPFKLQCKYQATHFGHRPINESCTNGYELFKGNIRYNSKRKILVYCPINFLYMATYDLSNSKIKLIRETENGIKHTRENGKILLSKSTPFGTRDFDMTKDYIVAVQSDKEYEEALDKQIYADKQISSTHSVFVYDYDLNLLKIYNFPFAIVRIAGDNLSNDVYLLASTPDFKIIRFKI